MYFPFFTIISRYDWYQTETHVIVTALIKNLKNENVSSNFTENSVSSRNLISIEELDMFTFCIYQKWKGGACKEKVVNESIEQNAFVEQILTVCQHFF